MTQNFQASGVSGACPDVDTLADLHAGLLEGETARSLREHVSSCAACTEVLAALDATVAALGSMPVPQIPADVAARIDRAIAIESGRIDVGADVRNASFGAPTGGPSNVHQFPSDRPRQDQAPDETRGGAVASLAAHRERRASRGKLLLAAAAAAAVLGVGTFAISQNSGTDTSNEAAGKQTSTAAHTPGAGGEVQSFRSPKDVLERGAIENDKVSTEVAGKMAELSERNQCLSQIIPRPASAPEAVEAGEHNGKKAYAFVFPTKDPDVVEMIIVDANDCSVQLDKVTGPRN